MSLTIPRIFRSIFGKETDPGDQFQLKAFTIPRQWSNAELRKIAHLFSGDIVNVSAWEDRDKENSYYTTYFSSARTYSITNFGTSQGALQYQDNELFLDLEQPLNKQLIGRFDVVFNHTTLEHIWDFRTAFSNLCHLSRDIVILIVPWLQPLHSDYGDFWRFSPQAIVRLFEEQAMTPLSLTWNTTPNTSVYLFAVASHNPDAWRHAFASPPASSSDKNFCELPSALAGGQIFD